MYTFPIKTNKKTELIDITSVISDVITKENYSDGILFIYSPHTTSAITINEGADPAVKEDILNYLNKIITNDFNYKHLEGNSPAHIKTSIFGAGEFVFVENKKLVLGTWQRIFFAEFDGPRNRTLYLKFIKSN